jgi:hypothetical protein
VASVVQGHRNPFGKTLAEHTVPELDFVLEMAAIDDPERWTFTRGGADKVVRSEAMSRWRDSLAGKALIELMSLTGATAARAGIERWRNRRSGGMRPGLTRRGKEIGDGTGT